MSFSIPSIPVTKSLFLNDKFIILVVLVSFLVTLVLAHQVASLGKCDGGGGNNNVILIKVFGDDDDALAVRPGGRAYWRGGGRGRVRTDPSRVPRRTPPPHRRSPQTGWIGGYRVILAATMTVTTAATATRMEIAMATD